jgi:cytochrome P450
MISNAVKLMLERGIDAQKAFATPASTEAHVEEALRLDPPLHLFTRYALEPVTLGGISLQTGDQVGLLLAAANRDPQRFSDPDRLDPGRERAPHMSFGAGIHFCLGAPLARLELQVALPILFARLPGVALDGTPRYRDSYHFHGLEALHLAWPTGSVSRTEARTAL